MGELVSGFLNGMADRRQEKTEEEYKKLLVNQAKTKIELDAQKMKAFEVWQQNPSDMRAAVMAGMNPKDVMMMQVMGLGMPSQTGTAPSAPELPSPESFGVKGGMFAPQPEQPGATFPAALTGLPTQENFMGIPGYTREMAQRDMLNKELGIGHFAETVRNVPVVGPKGERMNAPMTRAGDVLMGKAVQAPEDVTYQEMEIGGKVYNVPHTKTGYPIFERAFPKVPEYTIQEVANPDGSKSVRYFPKRPQAAPGTVQLEINPATMTPGDWKALQSGVMGGGTQISPAPLDMPIKDDEIPLWIDPRTMQPPPLGISAKEADKQGYKRMTTATKGTVDALKGAQSVVGQVSDMMGTVFGQPGNKSWAGQKMDGFLRYGAALSQVNPEAAELYSFIQGTLAPTVRSLGEKGNLSDNDMKRAINLMPAMTDTVDVAWKKIGRLQQLLNEVQGRAITGNTGPTPTLGPKPSGQSGGGTRYVRDPKTGKLVAQ